MARVSAASGRFLDSEHRSLLACHSKRAARDAWRQMLRQRENNLYAAMGLIMGSVASAVVAPAILGTLDLKTAVVSALIGGPIGAALVLLAILLWRVVQSFKGVPRAARAEMQSKEQVLLIRKEHGVRLAGPIPTVRIRERGRDLSQEYVWQLREHMRVHYFDHRRIVGRIRSRNPDAEKRASEYTVREIQVALTQALERVQGNRGVLRRCKARFSLFAEEVAKIEEPVQLNQKLSLFLRQPPII